MSQESPAWIALLWVRSAHVLAHGDVSATPLDVVQARDLPWLTKESRKSEERVTPQ